MPMPEDAEEEEAPEMCSGLEASTAEFQQPSMNMNVALEQALLHSREDEDLRRAIEASIQEVGASPASANSLRVPPNTPCAAENSEWPVLPGPMADWELCDTSSVASSWLDLEGDQDAAALSEDDLVLVGGAQKTSAGQQPSWALIAARGGVPSPTSRSMPQPVRPWLNARVSAAPCNALAPQKEEEVAPQMEKSTQRLGAFGACALTWPETEEWEHSASAHCRKRAGRKFRS